MNYLKVIILVALIPSLLMAKSFKIDSNHSYAGIKYRSNKLNELVIRLSDFKGKATLENGKLKFLKFKLSMKNLNTGNKKRDSFLKESVFKTKKYKSIHFETISIEETEKGALVKGILTINGKSKGTVFHINMLGPNIKENQKTRIGLSSRIEISRDDYNIIINSEKEEISDHLELNLQLQLVKKK